MADTDNTVTAAEDTTVVDVLTAVSETIKDRASEEVVARVQETFVERELTKRTDALVKAFDKLSAAKGDLNKIKPDNVLYNEDETVASSTFSKAKLEERNKARKAVKKIEDAINAALAGDFSKVYNI